MDKTTAVIQLCGEILISIITLCMSFYMVAFDVGDGYPSVMIGVVLTFWFTRGGGNIGLGNLTSQVTSAIAKIPPPTTNAAIEQIAETVASVKSVGKNV